MKGKRWMLVATILLVLVIGVIVITGCQAGGSTGGSGSSGGSAGTGGSAPNTTVSGGVTGKTESAPVGGVNLKEINTRNLAAQEEKSYISMYRSNPIPEVADKIIPYYTLVTTAQAYDTDCFCAPSYSNNYKSAIFGRLCVFTKYTDTSVDQAEMYLAKSVKKLDDGVTFDVELYDYIEDYAGCNMKASDIKWSYEQAMGRGEATELASVYDSIEIVDDYHLKIKLNAPGPNKEIILLGFHWLGCCCKDTYEAASETERLHGGFKGATGRYMLTEYVEGERAVLELQDHYWQKPELFCTAQQATVQTIYWVGITEKAVRAIALENGEVDYSSIDAAQLKTFFDTETGEVTKGFNVQITPAASGSVVFLNMDTKVTPHSPVSDNLKLRQAILYGIDADSMHVGKGLDKYTGFMMYDIGTPGMGGYNKDWEKDYFAFNPQKAKALLAEAGYPDGIKLRWLCKSTQADGFLAVFQEDMADIGIELEMIRPDNATYNMYKYDSTVWDINIDEKGGYSILDDWNNMFNPAGYANYGVNFWNDPTLFSMLDKAMSTEAQEDIDAIHNYMVENAIAKGIDGKNYPTVWREGIINIPTNGYNMHECQCPIFAADFTSNYANADR